MENSSASCCKPKVDQTSSGVSAENLPIQAVAGASSTKSGLAPEAPAGDVRHSDVSEYYGKTIQKQEDLLTSACLLEGEESKEVRQLVRNVHPEILDKFYGCGSPIPSLLQGATVLDLGCGTGRDCYTAAQLVGEKGHVIGVDMTEEQLAIARKHEEWQRAKFGFKHSNVEFKHAFIEDLKSAGIADESVDVVISNCVINLAPEKEPVLREIQRVLKPGGELYFSDMYSDRRVPEHLKKDKVLFGECLSGALYLEDFRRLMAKVGLSAWGITTNRLISINSEKIAERLGDVKFYSITVRAVKVPAEDAEDSPEDYGQVAVYRGTIPGHPEHFTLDQVRRFWTNVPTPVDSTTAAVLQASRYGKAFEVSEKLVHKGPFTLWKVPLPSQAGGNLGGEALRQMAEEADPAAATRCC